MRLLFLTFLAAFTLSADEIYDYTSPPFSVCGSVCSISGYFDVSAPLGDNLNDVQIFPTSFDFDGITQANVSAELFHVTTDGAGQIVGQDIELTNSHEELSAPSPVGIVFVFDYDDGVESYGFAGGLGGSGSWTETSSVPEPALWPLCLLFGIALLILRRKVAR
jgi:hypothetical protein